MDEKVTRQTAFKRADALAQAVMAASRTWPAQERSLYSEIRQAALRTPALVAAAAARDTETASREALYKALEAACSAEYLLYLAAKRLPDTAGKLAALASEAREAIQDHIAAMRLG